MRLSNIELLRILSMFFVLGIHANYLAIGSPDEIILGVNGTSSFLRIFFELLTITAVNIFVLISGWFGIKFRLRNMLKLCFQCFFLGIVVLLSSMFLLNLEIKNFVDVIFLRTYNMWFVYAYLGLVIISPILNRFVENTTKKEFLYVLICFFFLQTYLGWYRGFIDWYERGYSTISFIGLYLLARYIKLFPNPFIGLKAEKIAFIFVLLLASLSSFSFYSKLYLKTDYDGLLLSYINPFVIILSLLLLLFFSRFLFSNKIINWIASSAFSVYVIHCHPLLFDYYKEVAFIIYDNFSEIYYWVFLLSYLCLVFIISILIDKLRILCWNCLNRFFSNLLYTVE